MKQFRYLILATVVLMALTLSVSCNTPNEPPVEEPTDTIPPVEFKGLTLNVGNVTFRMVEVEHGTFMMGGTPEQTDAYDDEFPVHEVTISKDFYMSETEVTQALWTAVMGNTIADQQEKTGAPQLFGEGDNYPMYYVNLEDCQAFVERLSELTGKTFRLPTEAEWEYAARGGNKSMGYGFAGENELFMVAWFKGNSEGTVHEVGQLKPNELGLYDMSGNVCEWCSDIYGPYAADAVTDPMGAEQGDLYVNRGGGFKAIGGCRVAYRNYIGSALRECDLGIRLVLVP